MGRWAAGSVAGALALVLVGASAGAATPRGTASTSLLGLDLELTGPAAADVSLLDLTTYASTDPDADRAGPLAEAALVPLRHAGRDFGAVTASSQGDGGTASSPTSLPAGLPVDARLDAVTMSASATAERAEAIVGAAGGSLSALTDALGLDVELTGVESLVTTEGSAAVQGLRVSGFDLALGDLLPLEVLELLPLDVILELAGLLPVGIPALDTVVTDLRDVQALLDRTVADAAATAEELDDALEDLAALLAAQQAVDDAVAALEQLGLSDDVIADLLADPSTAVSGLLQDPDSVAGIGGGLTPDADGDGSGDTLQDTVDDLLGGDDGSMLAASAGVSAAALTELEQGIVDLAEALAEQEALEEEVGTIEEVAAAIEALIAELTTLVALIEDLIEDVLGLLVDLEGLLPDLLTALEDGEILSVGDLEVGITARAGATAADSSATVVCSALTVGVAGRQLTTPDCATPLSGVSGTVTAALGVVSEVLGALPTTVVELPDVRLDAFSDLVQDVSEAGDGTVTATAGVTILDVSLPSVVIDPDAVVAGLLDRLLDGLVAELTAQVPSGSDLTELGLSEDLGSTLDALVLSIAEFEPVTDAILDLLAGLPTGLDLPEVATPGVALTVDPVSTASFTPVAAAPGGGDGGGAAPDDPDLPSTGGGPVLVGLLALAGAAALRRRR